MRLILGAIHISVVVNVIVFLAPQYQSRLFHYFCQQSLILTSIFEENFYILVSIPFFIHASFVLHYAVDLCTQKKIFFNKFKPHLLILNTCISKWRKVASWPPCCAYCYLLMVFIFLRDYAKALHCNQALHLVYNSRELMD